MIFLLLIIPNLLSVHEVSAVDIISTGGHLDESLDFESPLLSLNDIYREEISNETNHFNYYQISINQSYTNCDYLYITTCCDYMDTSIDTSTYNQQCSDSSLDTIIELYHERKNQYHLLQNSYQYYHCKNPGKSFIDLYGYNEGQYIISVEGYGEEFGLYSLAFICEHDIETTSSTEGDTELKCLFIVAWILMITSALFGGLFVIIIIISNWIRINSDDPPSHNQQPVHPMITQQTSTLSMDVNPNSLNQNADDHQSQQDLVTNSATNNETNSETNSSPNNQSSQPIMSTTITQHHSELITNHMYATAPSKSDAPIASSLPITIVTSALAQQNTESEQFLSDVDGEEEEEKIMTKKSPFNLDSIKKIIKDVSYQSVDGDDDDVKYLERNQSAIKPQEEDDIVERISTSFPSPRGSKLEMSLMAIMNTSNTESKAANNDSTRSLPLPTNAHNDGYTPNLSKINEGRGGNLNPRDINLFTSKGNKSVSADNILDLKQTVNHLPTIPDIDAINYDKSAEIWKNSSCNNNRDQVSPTSKAATLSNPVCDKNKCREKIHIIDQMQFNIKAGGIDIYQVYAIRYYYAMKWKKDEDISWDKVICGEHLLSLGRLILCFLMQTLFLLAVDLYLLYDFIKVGKCMLDPFNNDLFDNDTGIHLCLRGVAFILSLMVIMKITKLFDDTQNRGLYRALRKYDSDLIYPETEWISFWLRFGQIVNWIASGLCILGSFAIIFDTRDGAMDEDGNINIIAAGITMILKILSIFYVANIDSSFILVHEKLICIRYLDERKSEIRNPARCELWENTNSTCFGYKAKGERCDKCCQSSVCFRRTLNFSRFLLYLFGAVYAGFVWVCW